MKPKAGRKRLDLLLVERGCAESSQKATAMILAGEVQVDGKRAGKAGMPVAEDAIGSSHGGFTDCLLQHGAARVYAIDVNVEQLDWKLRQNPRVIPLERNARELKVEDLPESVDIVVIDVSFISVRKAITPAVALAKSSADLLILVKPQFELRREEIAPGGIVKDRKLHDQAIQTVREYVESVGLEYLAVRPSRLLGAEGNQEYFLHARKKTLG